MDTMQIVLDSIRTSAGCGPSAGNRNNAGEHGGHGQRPRWVLLLGLVSVVSVSGCTSRGTRVWVKSYRPVDAQAHEPTQAPTIHFERFDYEFLKKRMPKPDGYEAIGISERRSLVLGIRPDAMNSKLRKQASRVGANLVLWAESPVGLAVPETVTVTWGNAKPPEPQAETIADYLAIFYREMR
jgi:hypothetical protein